jgi:hypothetical protein
VHSHRNRDSGYRLSNKWPGPGRSRWDANEAARQVRETTSDRILEGLFGADAPAKARAAVKGWLWYMDGVLLDWIEHRDLDRAEVRDLLLATLGGALTAAA